MRNRYRNFQCLIRFFFLFSLPLALVAEPSTASAKKDIKIPKYLDKIVKFYRESPPALDFVIVEVNGEKHLLKDQEQLDFVRGDVLTVVNAKLKDGAKPKIVNVLGFQNPANPGSEDDLGVAIDTSEYLNTANWAIDSQKETYLLLIQGPRTLQGMLFLHRIEPRLEYAEVLINKEPVVLRNGEKHSLKKTDAFKIARVTTNLREAHEKDIDVRLVGKKENDGQEDETLTVDLVFSYKKYRFATITLLVQ